MGADMKRGIFLFAALFGLVFLIGCGSQLVPGSEKTYYGTVTDRAMSVVNEGDITGRSYLGIKTDDGGAICFWMAKGYENSAAVGDSVIVESAIEEKTNLLVAIDVKIQN